MLGWADSLITTSGDRSIPVLAGTLYSMTGTGLASATWNVKVKGQGQLLHVLAGTLYSMTGTGLASATWNI